MAPNRRDLLELTARAVALSGASNFFANWLTAASHAHGDTQIAPPDSTPLHDYVPKFFNSEDFDALRSFTEILIPTDETPGAREAHCAHFIDFVLGSSTGFAPEPQTQWRRAMAALREAGFHSADAAQRISLVERISEPERNHSVTHPAYFAYHLIKRENAFAFYTSRAGIIGALDYRGNSYNAVFPACEHPEHHTV